jgi:hypothetical protein
VIPPCPNCGTHETFVNCQARGPAKYHYSADGEFLEVYYDKFYFELSKTVRCADCNKIRRDLELVDSQIRVMVREGEGGHTRTD